MAGKVVSFIKLSEKIQNIRAYRTSTKEYFPAYVQLEDNKTILPALFTSSDIKKATDRAANNLEDMAGRASKNVFTRLVTFKWF